MIYSLSKTEIHSFEGDIIPLLLLGGKDVSSKHINWSAQGDCILMRTFTGENSGFTNGVLITLLREGSAQVSAEIDGMVLSCSVAIRKRRQAAPNDDFHFYVGDFHDHTTTEHNHDRFAVRETGLVCDYLAQIHNDDKMDAMVITDHSDTTNRTDFFRGFVEEERFRSNGLVVFPGAESEVTKIETDRLGYGRKNSGEIVTLNCDNFSAAKTWEEFYDDMSSSPFGVCILAHPQIVGYDKNGIWNFSLEKNNTDQLKGLVKFIEIGNGVQSYSSNTINEHIYSVALDNGFFVSTTCSSDCHGPEWGYDVFPGKTIIMAPEKSREMFLDALLNRRAYACESGNIKLLVKVNGSTAPCTVRNVSEYNFHVDLSYFCEDADSVPAKCEVISNYGNVIKVIENTDFSAFDFKVDSAEAVYFYLRFIDQKGRRTFSPPVLTGRKLRNPEMANLKAVSKEKFRALDAFDESDVGQLLNNDPMIPWYSRENHASVVIDMGEVRKISAFGHYPYRFTMEDIVANNWKAVDILKCYPHKYTVSVSIDGQHYEQVAEGQIRVFGAEEVIRFPETDARYVKFDVAETVGSRCGNKEFANAPVCLGELTVFENERL